MPLSHRVDRDAGVAFATATGALGDEEVLDFAKRMANDPEFRSGVHELIDLRAADLRAVTSRTLRRVAEIFAAFDTAATRGRIAFVAPADVAFGLSRMYQAYRTDAVEVRVFREMDEARAWLGLPPEEPARG